MASSDPSLDPSTVVSSQVRRIPSPPVPSSVDKSYASLFYHCVPIPPPSYSLNFIQPAYDNGLLVAPLEFLDRGLELWSEIVVGFFLERRLPFYVVENSTEKNWSGLGTYHILGDKNLFYIKFEKPEDRNRFLALGQVFIAGKHFLLQQWNTEVEPQKERIDTTLVWAQVTTCPNCFGMIWVLLLPPF